MVNLLNKLFAFYNYFVDPYLRFFLYPTKKPLKKITSIIIKSSYITFVLRARPAMRAAAALPALFSSTKLMVELMNSKHTIPTKSSQSGGRPPPFAKAIAIRAAASITHDKGFHMKPKNLIMLLFCVLPNHKVKKVSSMFIFF